MSPFESIQQEKQMAHNNEHEELVLGNLKKDSHTAYRERQLDLVKPKESKGAKGSTAGSLKFDGDKPQMDLVPLSSVYAVAQVMTFGAKKYSADGWKDVPDARNRYTAAMLRHLTAIQDGEIIDPDSGLPHLDHVACNSMFLSWFRRNPERGL